MANPDWILQIKAISEVSCFGLFWFLLSSFPILLFLKSICCIDVRAICILVSFPFQYGISMLLLVQFLPASHSLQRLFGKNNQVFWHILFCLMLELFFNHYISLTPRLSCCLSFRIVIACSDTHLNLYFSDMFIYFSFF